MAADCGAWLVLAEFSKLIADQRAATSHRRALVGREALASALPSGSRTAQTQPSVARSARRSPSPSPAANALAGSS